MENLDNLTENPNPDIISFIKKKIPNIDSILKQLNYLKSENILSVLVKPIINYNGDLVDKNISNNPNIDVNKRYLYRNIKEIATRLETKINEYKSNIEGKDENPKGEVLNSLREIFLYIYAIYLIISNIIENNPNLSQEDKKFFEESKVKILQIFQKSDKAEQIFNNKDLFKNFPKFSTNFKIPKYINMIKKDNKKSKDNENKLKQSEIYYYNKGKFEVRPIDITFDLPYKDKTTINQDFDFTSYAIKESSKAGYYELFYSPFNDNKIKNQLIQLINKSKNKKDIFNKINQIYFIDDISKNNFNKKIKNIEIEIDKKSPPIFEFDEKKITFPKFDNRKLGILKIS